MDMHAVAKSLQRDRLAALLGIELVEVSPGAATVRMTVTERVHNAVGIMHGGAVFTMADYAFAAASNSHGTIAVAVNASISFIRPVVSGVLTARAEEVSRGKKLGTYSIRVTDEADNVVALFQGTVFRKDEPLPE